MIAAIMHINQPIDITRFNHYRRRASTDCPIFMEVADRLSERLDFFKFAPKRIAIVGPYCQYIARTVAVRYPNSTQLLFDARAKFLKRKFWQRRPRAFVTEYQRMPVQPGSIDLLIANLSLLGVDDFTDYFQTLYTSLSSGGALLFTTFGPDTLRELRQSFVDDTHAHVHQFVDMHDLGDLLLRLKFENPVLDMQLLTVQYGSLATLFTDLKLAGFNNAHLQRRRSLTGTQRWQRMLQSYEACKQNDCYPVTLEIVMGHAWIPAEKTAAAVDHEVAIPISQITTRGKAK